MMVTGEIIDLSCYLQVGKHGGKHRDCGQKCLRNGQPIGLLTKDGTVYLLMEEEHDPRRDGLTNFRQAAIDHMAYVMEVTGTFSEVGGQIFVFFVCVFCGGCLFCFFALLSPPPRRSLDLLSREARHESRPPCPLCGDWPGYPDLRRAGRQSLLRGG
jgi:hypothetical protein